MRIKDDTIYLCIVIGACLVALLMSLLLFRVRSESAPDTKTFNTEYSLALQDYSGTTVHLFDYRRKVLIAYAWASWCPYCGSEIQDLAALKQQYGDDVEVVAINRAEPPQTAKHFTDALSNTQGIVFLLDPDDSFFKEIGGYAMPEMVFIDSKGTIVDHQRGPIQLSDVKAQLERMLR